MTRRTLAITVATIGALAAAPAVGAAVTTTTTKPRIEILGGASFVANRYIRDEQRFNKDVYAIKSGSTIQIASSKAPEEPHTISVVKASDLPRTVKGFDACFEKGVCGRLAQAHGFPEGDGPPKEMRVDKGAAGFDTVGDSLVVAPGGGKSSVKLTAKKGRTLTFFCAIHPWMQAKIAVK